MPTVDPRKGRARFFAVASLGKNRWYWVVWPSLEELQAATEPLLHIGEGYEQHKSAAIDRALALAGADGEWIAAKHARSYHRSRAGAQRGTAPRATGTAGLGAQEFLYRDSYDADRSQYSSTPHRVVKKMAKWVYIEQRPYSPGERAGNWLDEAPSTFRLDRQDLEREGHAYISVLSHVSDADEPLFFVRPRDERLNLHGRQLPPCFQLLGLSWPCTSADVKAAYRRMAKGAHPDGGGSHDEFLALQEAYTQALWICR